MTAEASRPNYHEDLLLRREAGEGWREGGLDEDLLGAIACREYWIDEANEQHVPLHNDENSDENPLAQSYRIQVERVQELKRLKGISDPPPRKP